MVCHSPSDNCQYYRGDLLASGGSGDPLFGSGVPTSVPADAGIFTADLREFDLITGRMRYFSVDFNIPLTMCQERLPLTWSDLFLETQSSSICSLKWPATWVTAPACSNRRSKISRI